MKLHTYSSLAAFTAHWSALRAAPIHPAVASVGASTSDDAATLAAMEHLLADLSASDRDALRDDAPLTSTLPAGATRRHRARAEMHLRRLLAARGILAG